MPKPYNKFNEEYIRYITSYLQKRTIGSLVLNLFLNTFAFSRITIKNLTHKTKQSQKAINNNFAEFENAFITELNARTENSDKELDFLLITSTRKTDGVYLWRIQFLAEELKKCGYTVETESILELSSKFVKSLFSAKTVIFSRPSFSNEITVIIFKYLKKIK